MVDPVEAPLPALALVLRPLGRAGGVPVVGEAPDEIETGDAVALRAGGVTLRSLPGRAEVAVIEDPEDWLRPWVPCPRWLPLGGLPELLPALLPVRRRSDPEPLEWSDEAEPFISRA